MINDSESVWLHGDLALHREVPSSEVPVTPQSAAVLAGWAKPSDHSFPSTYYKEQEMKPRRRIAALPVVAALAIVAVALAGFSGRAEAAPPEAVCVPASAVNPVVPHDTWSGLEITLKGTAHDPDGDGDLATYEWDFGDGSPVESGAVTDPYAIEARHTYVGSLGDLFIATLTVTDLSGETDSDQYLVEIKDGADLTVKVNVAIDEGLWRLHKDQVRGTFSDGTPHGYWPYGGNSLASTGASTEAFEIQGSLPSGDASEDPYVETVQRGLNYLLSEMQSHAVSQHDDLCPLGDPDTNGNGMGLTCCIDCWHSMYESGIALMALASSRCPSCIAAAGIPEVVGRSYLDIAQDMVDYFAYAQSDPVTGSQRGGWRYYGNFREWGLDWASDNSVSQWPVIGMESAEVNFGAAGLVVPQFVKDELDLWIDYIQNDVDGDWADGGSGYSHPWDWVNVAKTGGLLAEMKFVGDTTASTRVQDAVDFIATNWNTDWEHFPVNSYYAFYSVMKGFRLFGIETIEPINDPSGFDWYGDPTRGYAQYIVDDQVSDGAWHWGYWSGHPLTSAWAILTLKKTVVQPGPVADAGPDVPSHPPIISITFDGAGSFHRDPSRNIVLYLWDFGDGSPLVEGEIVSHAFPAVHNPDGTIDWPATTQSYIVTLQVVDDSDPSLADWDTAIVHIVPPPWPPVADANGPYTIYPCWRLTLDGSGSYDPNGELYPDPSHPWHGELVRWEWDLDNDGEYDDATGETVPWSNCSLGVYVVGLKVTNSFGESDEVDTVINVTSPPPPVPVDVKPESCPNPLNTKDTGVLPVAILGIDAFDPSQVDPATVMLEGSYPLRWSLEDVATPYEPFVGKEGAYDCTELGLDGYPDLVLMFSAQEVLAHLGDVYDGDVLVLYLSGNLKDEFGGSPFVGEDVVRIIRKGKP
jgi:PKD repeat protein